MNFFVRIEMHRAGEREYQALHRAMAAAGYSRQVVGYKGLPAALPAAMYVREASAYSSTIDEQSRVEQIAHSIQSGAWTLVMRCDDWAGYLAHSESKAA